MGRYHIFLSALIKCRSALFGDSSPVSLGGDLRCLGGARGVISELTSLAKTFPRRYVGPSVAMYCSPWHGLESRSEPVRLSEHPVRASKPWTRGVRTSVAMQARLTKQPGTCARGSSAMPLAETLVKCARISPHRNNQESLEITPPLPIGHTDSPLTDG